MSRENIERAVIKIITEHPYNTAADVKASDAIATLNFDSLDCVELVMEFENEFDINIADEAAEKWLTVQDIIDYVIERKKQE